MYHLNYMNGPKFRKHHAPLSLILTLTLTQRTRMSCVWIIHRYTSLCYIIFSPTVMYLALGLCGCFFANDLYVTCAAESAFIAICPSWWMSIFICSSLPPDAQVSPFAFHRRNVAFYSCFSSSPGLFLSCSCCSSLFSRMLSPAIETIVTETCKYCCICLHLLRAESLQMLIFDSPREQLARKLIES